MIPDIDLARVKRWVAERNDSLPPEVRSRVSYELELSDRAVTVVENRSPWRPRADAAPTRAPVARFRYTKIRCQWSLYWRDANDRFHRYEGAEPTPHLRALLAEVDRDPTGIFWG